MSDKSRKVPFICATENCKRKILVRFAQSCESFTTCPFCGEYYQIPAACLRDPPEMTDAELWQFVEAEGAVDCRRREERESDREELMKACRSTD